MVYNRQYHVVPLAFRKLGDEVEGNMLEGESLFGCRDMIDGGSLSMCEDLVLLANCASRDVVC